MTTRRVPQGLLLPVQPFQVSEHQRMWAQVPAKFRTARYELADPDFARIFTNTRTHWLELHVDLLPETLGQEITWWVWNCGLTGSRRLNPGWISTMVIGLVELLAHTRTVPNSVVEVEIDDWLASVKAVRFRRLGRVPAANSMRVILNDVRHLQRTVNQQHVSAPWWQLDVWAPTHDPRIPVSLRDPSAGSRINFLRTQHQWLREGLKYEFRVGLETGHVRWGTLLNNRVGNGRYLDDFLTEQKDRTGVEHGPKLVSCPAEDLRGFVADYVSYLRSRRCDGGPNKGRLLAPLTVATAVTRLSMFYQFAFDNRRELAATTGEPRWLELTESHLRISRASDSFRVRPTRSWEPAPGQGVIAAEDLSTMLEHLDVLGMTPDQEKTFTHNGVARTVRGKGDPSSMRAWLLQAMTGRRCNEILKCVFNPLEQVDALQLPTSPGEGIAESPTAAREEEFVARFHYGQTKIDGAPSTILVGRDVVTIIEAQQRWVRQWLNLDPGDADPPFLFPRLRRNRRGHIGRPDSSYHHVLQELSQDLALTDRHGRRLEYSKSHRLRHTKATTLLNLGAPVHVVMRYLGHTSPEMTLYYARTLEEVAERELLKTLVIGRDGRDLDLTGHEVADVLSLSARTDRILPTGLCLLPPTKSCERGNACYTCHFFATDQRYLDDHRQLLAGTLELIEQRKRLHHDRTGTEMPENNVWLEQQLVTVRSLELIIGKLQAQAGGPPHCAQGAGTHGRGGYQQRTPVTITIGPHPGARP